MGQAMISPHPLDTGAIRAVLFDRDDTLSFSDPAVYRQAAEWAARTYGLDPRAAALAMQEQWASVDGRWWHLRTLDDEAAFWADYGRALAARLGLPDAHAAALLTEYPYQRFLRAAPEAREVLTELRARGLRIGVLSNTLPNVAVTLEAVGLDDLIDVPMSSCTLGVHKPNPKVFALAAELMGLPPAQILFVDDLEENILAARQAGMPAALIDHHTGREEALPDLRGVLDLVGSPVASGQSPR